MISGILAVLGPLLKFGVDWFTKKNSTEMVKRAEANNIQLNMDELRALIHEYHFGATQAKKDAALFELRRRGAMT
jgi:hypothetical protein